MSIQKAIAALSFVPPQDRDLWVKIGMSLKAEFGEDGFDAWDSWSQGAESYSEKSARAVWRSIGGAGKIGIGSLFHEAAANGWRDNGEHRGPLTKQEQAERRRAHAARDAATAAEEERKRRGYAAVAAATQNLIDVCTLETHYYLNSKGLPAAIGLVAEGVLVVPMRNFETWKLAGAQTVEWVNSAWEKKMLPGMRAKGAVLRLGSPHALETFMVEGYATGLSVEMALRRLKLNASVLVCFSDSNMAHVATMVTGRAFVCADHDVSGAGERAAIKTGFPYCMSSVVGNDANDDHAQFGLIHLCKMLIEVRRK
jgi:putative DNA primase/helicase